METLHWRYRGFFRPTVEIFSNTVLYGRLKFFNVYLIDRWNKVQAETFNQKWLFVREKRASLRNLGKDEISIRDINSGLIQAVYKYQFKLKFEHEGELKFTAGASYVFQINYRAADKFLTITDNNKNPLLISRIKVIKWRWFQSDKGDIEVLPVAKTMTELPLLILFGQYVVGYMRQTV